MLKLETSWVNPIDPDENEDDEEEEEEERDPIFDNELAEELGYEQDQNGEWHRDDS